MNQRLIIINAIIKDNELTLVVENSQELTDLKASGQMLVDSAGVSFVYLLEREATYTYIPVPHIFWSDLKRVLTENLSISITNGKEKISLTHFNEELTYLIENIKGNSNYGEEMVNKVEAVFG